MSDNVESFTSMIRGLSSASADKRIDVAVSIDDLHTSSFQPRVSFNNEELQSLAASIRENGLINPITVRESSVKGKFEIIAGERRFRALVMLGWQSVPVIIKKLDDKSAQAVALVENLQREDLNPIEEACGYKELLEKHGLTHDQVAESVGKPRSTVSNFIRLLELDDSVQELLKHKKIDVGHAKLLVSLSKNIQGDLANNVASKSLSVRQLETLIKRTVFASNSLKSKPSVDGRFKDISVFLKRKLGEDFEVCISKSSPNKISFSSEESLLKFMELLT